VAEKKKWLICCLTPLDLACIDHVSERHFHAHRSGAVRLAILTQSRDVVHDRKLAEECGRIYALGRRAKRFVMALTAHESLAIDRIAKLNRLKGRAAAVRLAVRAQAKSEGMKLPETRKRET
jgi:hypothetical protein